MSKQKVLILFFIWLTVTACGISVSQKKDDTEMLKLQLTQQSLTMTQVASSNANNQSSPSNNDKGGSSSAADDPAPAPAEEEDDGIPCNDSHIIGETIKDGTVFKPGQTFAKTWTLRNEGDCDWTTGYALKFIEGNRLNGESSVKVPSVIEPGEDITFQVNLKAPDAPGDYTGVWQLFAGDDEELGRYWVKITVEDDVPPPPAFAVTSVSTNFKNSYNPGACPLVLDVEIYIKANGAGTVKYQPETSDLGKAPVDTLTFDKAGTKTETYTWTIHNSGSFWMKVNIIQPNNQVFGPFSFTLTCP